MTDYAHLDYPNNYPTKEELERLINLLNSSNIHYWVDFATLCKITNKKDDKFLYYLNTFELSIFEEDYSKFLSTIKDNGFYIWNHNVNKTEIASLNLMCFKVGDFNRASKVPVQERLLKWIAVWNYKKYNDKNVFLNIKNDFIIKKDLFLNTQEIDYCGLKLKIPKNWEELYNIRYSDKKGIIHCHSPRKRESCENEIGFSNIGNYK